MRHTQTVTQRLQVRSPTTVTDQHGRGGVLQEKTQLFLRVGWIQRMKHQARPDRTEIQPQGLNRLFHLHGHPVAFFKAQFNQVVCNLRRVILRISIRVGNSGFCSQQHRIEGRKVAPVRRVQI